MEQDVLPTQLGPQCPGRVTRPQVRRPSRSGTDGRDSASPGRPPTSWILDVGVISPGSSAKATQSQARWQRSMKARRRRRTATRRTSCRSSSKRAGVATRPACTFFPGCCRWRLRARLDIRRGMDALHCAASYGHWRFNRATCLHRLPRSPIVLLKVRGRGGNTISIAIAVSDKR